MRPRYCALPVVLLLALLALACPPPATLSPAGQKAYAANELIIRVGELQAAAIDANARIDPATNAPALATATTRRVVTFCVETTKTLKALPSGWQATVKTGFASLQGVLTPQEKQALGLPLEVIAVAVASFTAGGAQ